MSTFPDNFLWGAGTSSHQTEGDNFYNDWWHFENEGKLPYKSLKACLHYKLYNDDFDILKNLNLNAYRFSLEWSRIEPQEGKINHKEIEHYNRVLDALLQRGIKPVVVLFHFTVPLWFYKKGGFLHSENIKYFLKYVKIVSELFSGKVKFWITLNEPNVYAYKGFLEGAWPPFLKSTPLAIKVLKNLLITHRDSYGIIKSSSPDVPVGVSENMIFFTPSRKGWVLLNALPVFLRNHFFNMWVVQKSVKARSLDFIGVNYYNAHFVYFSLKSPLWGQEEERKDLKRNMMGRHIYPEGFYRCLLDLKKFNLPVIVTENGTCVQEDDDYWEFLKGHLEALSRAIRDGVQVKGYIWWSLMDNFEWDEGFSKPFGLARVDFQSFERTVRPFAYKFSEIIKRGNL